MIGRRTLFSGAAATATLTSLVSSQMAQAAQAIDKVVNAGRAALMAA